MSVGAFVFHPIIGNDREQLRTPQTCLDEAVGLCVAIHLDVVCAQIIRVAQPHPSTLFGRGHIHDISELMDAQEARPELVVVDGQLSPVQHRNLERKWQVKVLDRTALILEIFGARARTREGRLQVELAHLTYQRSRLVRSWTHLERQRGGAGFLGGPGERQIESDRRGIDDKIVHLKKQLAQVKRTRSLQRAKRKRAPYPVVALVGYTNAGKSTLFNCLTHARVAAQDLLFATLDPTMRAIDLPSKTRVIFSDTVGFISQLPTQLVAAFRATLEEVGEADLILHVRDAACKDTQAQKEDVLHVLAELGIEEGDPRPVIEVLNKSDLLDSDSLSALETVCMAHRFQAEGTIEDPIPVCLSALTQQGIECLYTQIDRCLTADHCLYHANVPQKDGAALAWLYAHSAVINCEESCDNMQVRTRMSQKTAGQFQKTFAIDLMPAEPGIYRS